MTIQTRPRFPLHASAADDGRPDVPLAERRNAGAPFQEVLVRRMARRDLLRGAAIGGALLATHRLLPLGSAAAQPADVGALGFEPIPPSAADEVIVPPGYRAQVLIRWGDALRPDVPDLDVSRLADGLLVNSPEAPFWQENWFGYNCDGTHYYPMPEGAGGGRGRRRALLAVNHEYTNDDLMFPGFPAFSEFRAFTENIGVNAEPGDNPVQRYFDALTPEQRERVVRVMQAAHGASVVEVFETEDGWAYDKTSPFNRRITANTPMRFSGPARNHPFLGREVLGMLNNCAAGKTPWGTFVTCEENFDQYFARFDTFKNNEGIFDLKQKALNFQTRTPLDEFSSRGWEFVDARFDVNQAPTEPFKFGWVVEIDPFDPQSTPVKRTALGRCKHECAHTTLAADRRPVVYSGDDARFEYVYKFVANRPFDPLSPAANRDLLDDGVLYVARFEDDGTGTWLPLVWGANGLIPENGFDSQADVLINTRMAADILGATPMDRPEDIETINGRVYVALTNNTRRVEQATAQGGEGPCGPAAQETAVGSCISFLPNQPNPRYNNGWGHIVEIEERGGDHAATDFRWNIFIMAGDPNSPEGRFLTSLDQLTFPAAPDVTYYAGYNQPDRLAAFGSPDNLNSDSRGNLWIVTDGRQPEMVGDRRANDGCFVVPTAGPERGFLRRFMSGPIDAEVCGCEFTLDETALFLAIQHPGDSGSLVPTGPEAQPPTSHWPDGGENPPRPSMVVVTKAEGDPRIGTGRG